MKRGDNLILLMAYEVKGVLMRVKSLLFVAFLSISHLAVANSSVHVKHGRLVVTKTISKKVSKKKVTKLKSKNVNKNKVVKTTSRSTSKNKLAKVTSKTINKKKINKTSKIYKASNNRKKISLMHAKKRDYMNGIASYYGGGKDGFDGKQMANGRYFDSSDFTAAHPTVPLGTKLKVTNLVNKRSVYVEITDRMPKKTGRVIDLSYGAGKYLGLMKPGIVRVKLTVVTNTEYSANRDTLLVASNDKGRL